MGYIDTKSIALFLDSDFFGPNIEVSAVSSIKKLQPNTLIFSLNSFSLAQGYSNIVLCTQEVFDKCEKDSSSSYVICMNPKLAFSKVVNKYFVSQIKPNIHKTAVIGSGAKISENVSIGPYCVIDSDSQIGRNTIINSHVVLSKNVIIGNDCYIKSGCVIGEDGFGFAFKDHKKPFRMPHLGGVIIGNNVEIGSNVSIARGTLDNTVIGDFTKIDDLVLIAHNCMIGKKNIITGCVDISGSVHVGDRCWFGPNSVIQEKIKIGNDVFIGMGSVVRRNIKDNQNVLPVESLDISSHLKVRKLIGIDKDGKLKS